MRIQVEETVASQRQLLQDFEASGSLIPDDELLELDYNYLVEKPLSTVNRIYDHFRLAGWEEAQGHIQERIAQARHYNSAALQLSVEAERWLQELISP